MMREASYRLTGKTFHPGVAPPDDRPPGYWFAFRGYHLLIARNVREARVPRLGSLDEIGLEPVRWQYLGRLDGVHCYSAELPRGVQAPDDMSFRSLRQLYGAIDEDLFWIAGRAVQIVDWDRTHQFCGSCGTPTEKDRRERVKVCPACDHTSYPRLAPAIIVAVTKGDKLLLARSHRHPSDLYSVLAGFVEPGETLEECVLREVKEEVGIDVKNIRYFGSQPWPFPNSLMIAFTCEYAGGTIRLEEEEMAEADWYTAGDLPKVPPPLSISRHLIDWFVDNRGGR